MQSALGLLLRSSSAADLTAIVPCIPMDPLALCAASMTVHVLCTPEDLRAVSGAMSFLGSGKQQIAVLGMVKHPNLASDPQSGCLPEAERMGLGCLRVCSR